MTILERLLTIIDKYEYYIDLEKAFNMIMDVEKISDEELQDIVTKCTTGERKNCCVECGMDMGQCNPRQLCNKSYCCNPKFSTLKLDS